VFSLFDVIVPPLLNRKVMQTFLLKDYSFLVIKTLTSNFKNHENNN